MGAHAIFLHLSTLLATVQQDPSPSQLPLRDTKSREVTFQFLMQEAAPAPLPLCLQFPLQRHHLLVRPVSLLLQLRLQFTLKILLS